MIIKMLRINGAVNLSGKA